MSNPQSLVKDLEAAGMSQTAIAEALEERGLKTTQATINRIASGKFKTTRWEIWHALTQLHAAKLGRRKVANG